MNIFNPFTIAVSHRFISLWGFAVSKAERILFDFEEDGESSSNKLEQSHWRQQLM
jgi:hypothetical protein